MCKEKLISEKIREFDKYLSNITLNVPNGFKIVNPFNSCS